MSTLTRLGRVTLARIGFALIFVGLAAGVWLLALSPRMEQADELTAQAADLELENLGLLSNLNRTRAQLENAPEVAQQAQALLAKMPQTADLPAVLDQITAAAVDAGIDPNQVSSITTGIPVPLSEGTLPEGVSLAQMAVSLSAQGGRQEIQAFLDNLQSLDRSLLITATQVTNAGTEGDAAALNLTVAGEMFVLQSKLPDLVATVADLLEAQDPGPSP